MKPLTTFTDSNVILNPSNENSNLWIKLKGYAGGLSNAVLNIDSSVGNNEGANKFGSGVFLVTNWKLWES